MMKPIKKIMGISLPEENFRVYETHKYVDFSIVHNVLEGNIAAYRISKHIAGDVCKRIVKNFWASPNKVPRFGYGKDGIEGYFIGASHIEKTTFEYLEEARNFESAVKELYEGVIDPVSAFREALAANEKNGRNIYVRPAQLNGLSASHSKAVCWNNFEDFLLEPHDDFAQLSDPRQNGFEIQKVNRVMAVNFYPKALPLSGQLKIWNIEPDNQSRANLGLAHSGFPYPAELLQSFSSITIPIETGDLCIINGNLVHAVLRGNCISPKDRLLIAFFMAFHEKNQLIWWT